MTLKEFRKITEDLPEYLEIFVGERLTEFTFGLVNSAKVQEINFSEDINSKPIARNLVLVLSEE